MIKFFAFITLLNFIAAFERSRRLNENTKRLLANTTIDTSASWEPLRIQFEYITAVDSQTQAFLSDIFSIAGTYLQRQLLIRRTSQTLKLGSNSASQFSEYFTMTDTIANSEYEADLVLFVTVENKQSETYLAYCSPVIYDDKTLRPIFGAIGWNMAYSDITSLTNTGFESQLATAIHEIIHGLGFVDELISSFYDFETGEKYSDQGSTTVDGIIMVTTPRVVAQAKKFFGCGSITGVPMEQEGGDGTAGSHWERTLFYNEMMTGSDINENFVLSDFTLQFLQDTGFYRLTDLTPDILTWGENEGCDFFDQQCKGGDFKEFCTVQGQKACSIGYHGVGSCATDDLAQDCPYIQIEKGFDCRDSTSVGYQDNGATFQTFGYQSMCVIGGFGSTGVTLPDFSCYKYSCDGTFTITVNGKSIDCSQGGNKTVDGLEGSITCPDNYEQFCTNQDDCLNQCSKRGFCLKGLCICHGSYYGVDCSQENCSKYKSGSQCVDSCPSGQYLNSNINYCIGCPANCNTCTSYNLCTECKEGYELRAGFCDYLEYSKSLILSIFINFMILVILS